MMRLLLPGGVLIIVAFAVVGGSAVAVHGKPDQYIKVEIRGVLRHGVMAIGGETTGTEITANGITWELDLNKRKDLRQKAEELDAETVVLSGTLERRKGVEIAHRWIVTVTSLAKNGGG